MHIKSHMNYYSSTEICYNRYYPFLDFSCVIQIFKTRSLVFVFPGGSCSLRCLPKKKGSRCQKDDIAIFPNHVPGPLAD